MTTLVGPIDVTGQRPIFFDFGPELAAGETLISVDQPIEVFVQAGADPSPQTVLVGTPVINGVMVEQMVKGQVANVFYHFRAHGTTDRASRPVVIANLRVEYL